MNTALSCPLLLWLIPSGICSELPQLSHCCAALSSRVKLNLETKQRDKADQPGSHQCRASAGGPQKGAECSYHTQPASPHLMLLTLHCNGRTGQACSQPCLGQAYPASLLPWENHQLFELKVVPVLSVASLDCYEGAKVIFEPC